MGQKKIVATDIKRALAKKHENDFFLTEVKNGSSSVQKGELKIIDAVAIKKSWAHPRITAYEVKVSVNDFRQDDKWADYLRYCHQFYFATPPKLISPQEVPENVGLVYMTTAGNIRTIKKAAYRQIDIDADFLMYIIMSRLDSDRIPFFSNQYEYWEEWVRAKGQKKQIGYDVSSKVWRLEQELKHATESSEALRMAKCLKEYGIFSEAHLESTLKLVKGLKAIDAWEIGKLKRNIGEVLKYIERLEESML